MLTKKRRFLLESLGRVISRGGDLLIANLLIHNQGEDVFLFATVSGAIWNGAFDCWWQRYIVNPERSTEKLSLGYILRYLRLRLTVAGLAFATLSFLFFCLEWSYLAASCVTTLVFWYISYQTTKKFFDGPRRNQVK